MNIKDFSTGIDIEKIERFEKHSTDKNNSFVKRIYTPNEIDYCFSDSKPAEHLAARFCAKEAVYKALSSLGCQNIDFTKIEILSDENGVPFVNLDKEKYKNIEIKISLSHGNGNAIASAFAIKLSD